ncbi:LysR family transcriptional regulator [Actibacterium sp. 188UL27-1]|uniref:LysR family transcriptional regulator n=1 Tax=Actibacterium sp. 188UL27-1 TaxID=2786961 RepID=UPI001957D1EE|nr:LysR family transcriptional regulator [Actibacterium sp. 188UL27-1]MBM7069129.1 LysR family transcriptional regulator [Actibacterium sp. 188UL27-1]
METGLASIDWSRLQAFVAVAECGSLSAAARELGTSQPTLGRQIKSLEETLDVTLFHRQARGLILSDTGAALLAPARSMRDAARQIALSAAGRSNQLAGTVRITASLTVSAKMMPPILARLRRKEPDIQIELVPSDESENLLFREADIAVRMYRPEQLDIVTRYIGDLALGLFGTKEYVDTLGPLRTVDDLLKCELVGYDRDERIIRGLRDFGHLVDRNAFATRCDNRIIYSELVRAGCGLGFGAVIDFEDDPNLTQVAADLPIPPLPVWLAAHGAMRQTPRIRRIWETLATELTPLLDPPQPAGSPA